MQFDSHWLTVVIFLALALMISRAPVSCIFWCLGPFLGIATVLLSMLRHDTIKFHDLILETYKAKLPDLYLICVITLACALADGFELAWMIDPAREHQLGKLRLKRLKVNAILRIYRHRRGASDKLRLRQLSRGRRYLRLQCFFWSVKVWPVVFFINMTLAIFVSGLVFKMVEWEAEKKQIKAVLLHPEYTVWVFIFISMGLGFVFRYALEEQKCRKPETS